MFRRGGTLEIELGGTNAATPDFDQLVVSGTVTLDGALSVVSYNSFAQRLFDSFRIIEKTSAGAISGTFSGLIQGSTTTLGLRELQINYGGGAGNDVTLTDTTGYRVWDGGAGNLNWADAENWGNNNAPGAGDNVYIDLPGGGTITTTGTISIASLNTAESMVVSGGSFTVSDPSSIGGNMSLVGGSLNGLGTVSVNGMTTLSGGASLQGAGILNAEGGLTLDLSVPGQYIYIGERTVNASGTITQNGPEIVWVNDAATINVLSGATWTIGDGSTIGEWGGPVSTFNNQGTIQKTSGTGLASFGLTLNNSGTVDVQAGRFDIYDGVSSGDFLVANDAVVWLQGQDLTATSSLSGAGTAILRGTQIRGDFNVTGDTEITGSPVTFHSTSNVTSVGQTLVASTAFAFNSGEAISVEALTLTGGSLQGTDNVTVSGLTAMSGGASLYGTGILNAEGGLTLDLSVPGQYIYIGERTVNASGTITQNGPEIVWVNDAATINVLPGATWTIGDGSTIGEWGGPVSTFNNQGTIQKTSGTGLASFGLILNNSGTVDVQAGTFELQSGISSGDFLVSSGATLNLFDQDLAVGSSLSGAGTAILRSTDIRGSYNITGETQVKSGAVTFHSTSNVLDIGDSLVAEHDVVFNSGESISTDTLTLKSSGLGGSDSFTVTGQTTLHQGGAITGSGIFNAMGDMTLDLSVPGRYVYIGERTLNVYGTTTQQGTEVVWVNDSATINVQSGAVWIFEDGTSIGEWGGPGSTLNNEGTIQKHGSGSVSIGIAFFNNEGVVDQINGILQIFGDVAQISAGELTGGDWRVDGNGVLDIVNEADITTNFGIIEIAVVRYLPKTECARNQQRLVDANEWN